MSTHTFQEYTQQNVANENRGFGNEGIMLFNQLIKQGVPELEAINYIKEQRNQPDRGNEARGEEVERAAYREMLQNEAAGKQAIRDRQAVMFGGFQKYLDEQGQGASIHPGMVKDDWGKASVSLSNLSNLEIPKFKR